MIRKVALVQALREVFPEVLGALYDAAEMGSDITEAEIPPATVQQTHAQVQEQPKRIEPAKPKVNDTLEEHRQIFQKWCVDNKVPQDYVNKIAGTLFKAKSWKDLSDEELKKLFAGLKAQKKKEQEAQTPQPKPAAQPMQEIEEDEQEDEDEIGCPHNADGCSLYDSESGTCEATLELCPYVQ